MIGNNDLPGTCISGRKGIDFPGRHAKHGPHATRICLPFPLHQLTTPGNKGKTVPDRENPGSMECTVFPQAVPGKKSRRKTRDSLHKGLPAYQVGYGQGRLQVQDLGQVLQRPVKAEPSQWEAAFFFRELQEFTGICVTLEEFTAHAHELGSLSREKYGCFFHVYTSTSWLVLTMSRKKTYACLTYVFIRLKTMKL
jgi:hypothetical protein